jgi:hypothetical protein
LHHALPKAGAVPRQAFIIAHPAFAAEEFERSGRALDFGLE